MTILEENMLGAEIFWRLLLGSVDGFYMLSSSDFYIF